MRGLALFDVDHTLTGSDTLPAFLNYVRPGLDGKFCWLKAMPFIAAWKLRLLSAERAKSTLLKIFFSNIPEDKLSLAGRRFARDILPGLTDEAGMNCLMQYKSKGFRCILVTASPELWIAPWSSFLGVECLATRLKFSGGMYVGLDGSNNNGDEKVRRILEVVDIQTYSDVHAFGDSTGDKPMLGLANKAFYRTFPENFDTLLNSK
jgi:phosphatidylglycerophosphatase C